MSDENENSETMDDNTAPDAAPAATEGTSRPNGRKTREGIVVSAAMNKTLVVTVVNRVRHRVDSKTGQRTTRF
mgnify:FL=1